METKKEGVTISQRWWNGLWKRKSVYRSSGI